MLQWVTDGGLETDLLFHHGIDLPEFAAFPLVDQPAAAQVLTDYYASSDGRLPDGTPLRAAAEQLDAQAAPDW